jgi:putative NADPH-quinone reductase
MKILVIDGNPKKKGALATLVGEVARGAFEAGADVETLKLGDMDIRYCRFCMNCYSDTGSEIAPCTIKDDMEEVRGKIKEADGYILACPTSSGHANAIMKTFIERSTYTIGRSTGKMLFIKGIPESRLTDRRRCAVTVTTAGAMPAWLRFTCNGSTREMVELADRIFNAEVLANMYIGRLTFRGLKDREKRAAYRTGGELARYSPRD